MTDPNLHSRSQDRSIDGAPSNAGFWSEISIRIVRYGRADRAVGALIVLAGFIYLGVRWVRLLTVGGGFDSTLLGNVLWRLANGFDSQTALTGGHYLSTHASPILALFLPTFRLAPALGMPLVFAVQTASVVLVAWAGYLVGRACGLTRSTRFWLLVALLASAASWLATQHQVNETTFGIGPLAMAVALSVRGDRMQRVIPWAALAASCRIEMAAAVLVAGIVLWTYGRPRHGRWIVVTSALFLAGYLTWLFLNPYETESVAAHFSHLGSTPTEVIESALSRPWAVIQPAFTPELLAPLVLWLAPFGILPPLLRFRWLLIALPSSAIAVLGVWPPADNPLEHYWYAFIAAGAIATPVVLSENDWLNTNLRPLLLAGFFAGWAILSPFWWFLFPPTSLTSEDRALAEAVHEVEPGFVSAPGALSYWLIDRPLLAIFPRPFRCEETATGPYTAPDVPPTVIIVPENALDLLDDETSSRLASLLRSYESINRTRNYEVWQVVDVDRAASDYVPCSSSTFTPSA